MQLYITLFNKTSQYFGNGTGDCSIIAGSLHVLKTTSDKILLSLKTYANPSLIEGCFLGPYWELYHCILQLICRVFHDKCDFLRIQKLPIF